METNYLSIVKKALMLLHCTLILSIASYSQKGKSHFSKNKISLLSGTDAMSIANYGQPNILIGCDLQKALCGSKSHYSRFGMNFQIGYTAYIEDMKQFTNEFQQYTFCISPRFYPIHNFIRQSSQKHTRNNTEKGDPQPCPIWYAKKRSHFEHDVFIAPAYRNEQFYYNYIAKANLSSPIASFPFNVTNNGIQLEVGYQLMFRFLFVEFGYAWFMSFPKTEGALNPFGESIYTSTFPIKYRMQTQYMIRAGIKISIK